MKNVLKLIMSTVLFFVFCSGYSQVKPKKAELKAQHKIEKLEAKDSTSKKKSKKPELIHSSKIVADSSKTKKKLKTKLDKTKTKQKLKKASKKKN